MVQHIQINQISNGFTVRYAIVDQNYKSEEFFFPNIEQTLWHIGKLFEETKE